MSSPPVQSDDLTPSELSQARRSGVLGGIALCLLMFVLPGLLGALVESVGGTIREDELWGFLIFVPVCLLLGALVGVRLSVWSSRRTRRSSREEVLRWVSLQEGERLQGLCSATLEGGAEPAPGVVIVTSERVLFLQLQGSRRRLATLGPAGALQLYQLPATRFAWPWESSQSWRLVFKGQDPHYCDLRAGLSGERLHSTLGGGELRAAEAPPTGSRTEPEWESLSRGYREPSRYRLVAQPLRRGLARGVVSALLATLFVSVEEAFLFGALVGALTGIEQRSRERSRLVRYVAVLEAGVLGLGVLLALVVQAEARGSGAALLSPQGLQAVEEALLQLCVTGDSFFLHGPRWYVPAGVALACALAVAWRLRVPLAGLLVLGCAGFVMPVALEFESVFLAVTIGLELSLPLAGLGVMVDISDTWLVGRSELGCPPSWSEVLEDFVNRRSSALADEAQAAVHGSKPG